MGGGADVGQEVGQVSRGLQLDFAMVGSIHWDECDCGEREPNSSITHDLLPYTLSIVYTQIS